MEQESKTILIRKLISEIEEKYGIALKSSKDFRMFAEQIPHQEPISMSTLKRLWQYVPNKHTPRDATLTILAKTVGYDDWYDFMTKHRDMSDSGFLSGIDMRKDIPVGTLIELRWSPNRQCVIRKTGTDRFSVVESIHGKLLPGDCFQTQRIEKGQPFIATHLTREGTMLPDYIAGRKYGLASIKIIKEKHD